VITDAQAAETMEVLSKILECATDKGCGMAFTVPIDAAIGVAPRP